MSSTRLLLVLFIACIALWPQKAQAGNRPYALTISPMAGGYLFEGSQTFKDRPFFSLSVGYNFTDRWAAEGVLGYLETVTIDQPEQDVHAYTARIDLLYHFRPQRRLVPYLAAGLGGISYDNRSDNSSNEDFLLGYGLGLKYFVSERIALRADVRHLLNFLDNDSTKSQDTYLAYTAGLLFQLGGQRPSRPAPVKVEIPATVPQDVVVFAPPPVPEPEPVILPADSDNDGVPDHLDRCPATPEGLQVEHNGCPEPLRVAVEFASGRSEIDHRYHSGLVKIATIITRTSGQVQIEGHTDSVGSGAQNLALSTRRAESVRAYLIERLNLPSERLQAVGFGASQPVADNSTQQGRALNRRVIILFQP